MEVLKNLNEAEGYIKTDVTAEACAISKIQMQNVHQSIQAGAPFSKLLMSKYSTLRSCMYEYGWGLKGMKCDLLMSDKHVAEPACND